MRNKTKTETTREVVTAKEWSAWPRSRAWLWAELQNVIVGLFMAFIRFVCSIGNVHLMAALFKDSLSLGGTVPSRLPV